MIFTSLHLLAVGGKLSFANPISCVNLAEIIAKMEKMSQSLRANAAKAAKIVLKKHGNV